MDTSCALPNELWDDVLGYVTKHDLKTLRLAGRSHLANLASPKLFTTAYIASRRGVIDALAGLASHSVLRHHVKTFVFDSSYLDPEIHGELSGDDWSNAVEAVHEDKELALAFAHQEYIQTYELRPALEQAFEAFPNIEKIVYADMSRTAYLPSDRLGSVTSLLDSNHPHLRRLLTGKFRKRVFACCLEGECGKKHLNFFRRQYSGLATMLEVMDLQELDSLRELSFGSNAAALSTAGIPCFFLEKTAGTFKPLLHSVWRLRRLDLTLCFPSLQQGPLRPDVGLSTARAGLDYAGLKRLLEYAGGLEELYLSGEVDVATLSLDKFWPNQTFGSLKTLLLRTTEASCTELSSLIWCNRHTLQHLELDDFNLLCEKGWPCITQFIQKHTPNLNVVYGYTWVRGVTRSITWSPTDVSASTHSVDNDMVADGVEEEDDLEDGSYSDGSDFERTQKLVGYRPKSRSSSDPHTNDGEYEDVFEVVKTLKVESDTESSESDSDDAPLNHERYDNRWWALRD